MKRSTLHIHEKLKAVGEEIGFITSAEVSPPSLAYIPIEKRYIPRVDVVWNLEISD